LSNDIVEREKLHNISVIGLRPRGHQFQLSSCIIDFSVLVL